MPLLEIMNLRAEFVPNSHVPRTSVDDIIRRASKALEGVKKQKHFALGTQIKDKGTVQITSEWDGIQDYMNLEATLEYSSFTNSVRTLCGKPDDILHVILSRSAFGPNGLATAPIVEFVQSYFPASHVTSEFQKQIEEDFVRFDGIYQKGVKGEIGLAYGWVLEEQGHEGIEGEKAKCFLVARGWQSMEYFEKSVQNDAYEEAIPILFGWNAPWKMWHVERKVSNDIEAAA
ncbi:hypothetical protein V492_01348 [Pseudogymnoascus sp. VKM F-4246]|nr:hypothetical protein V492_01348 [Pseudogymnoascus sp. VKM F-4246]